MPIAERIHSIQKQIIRTAIGLGRDPKTIQLLAVSKGQSVSAIRAAFAAGISQFGENYAQEAKEKMRALADLPIEWHFIGPIQSNKAAWIAGHFSWVHTVSREKIAKILSANRAGNVAPLNICVQVNLDAESSKSGILPAELMPFIQTILHLPNLRLRGLMAIPRIEPDAELQYRNFLRLKQLLETCNQDLGLNIHLDSLSMGMSDDMVMAIAAGSTCLRIGRAIFGERKAFGMQ